VRASKAPVRVALKRLDLLGLVRAVPRAGYIVTSVGLDDLAVRYAGHSGPQTA
jgi:DNA-binding GntR family transcriptional regulator